MMDEKKLKEFPYKKLKILLASGLKGKEYKQVMDEYLRRYDEKKESPK